MAQSVLNEQTILGRTGLRVSRIGLAGGYGVPAPAVEKAFHEYGVNTFYWETRKAGMGEALRNLLPANRDRIVIAIQSYDKSGFFLRHSVEKALRRLGTDYADILFLGWYGGMPWRRVLDRSRDLIEAGLVRHLGVTGHNRRFHGELIRRDDSPFDVQMIRYNAAHRGAEQEVFADLPDPRPGIITYVATAWGKLLKPKRMPPGEPPMSAADCYRFALSHPAVDLCWAGPRSAEQMEGGLQALASGPLAAEELERIRRIGDHVHG